jgi:hypothetical protein
MPKLEGSHADAGGARSTRSSAGHSGAPVAELLHDRLCGFERRSRIPRTRATSSGGTAGAELFIGVWRPVWFTRRRGRT